MINVLVKVNIHWYLKDDGFALIGVEPNMPHEGHPAKIRIPEFEYQLKKHFTNIEKKGMWKRWHVYKVWNE